VIVVGSVKVSAGAKTLQNKNNKGLVLLCVKKDMSEGNLWIVSETNMKIMDHAHE
jgi:hypothetical protein